MKTEKIISKRIMEINDTEITITCDICGEKMSRQKTCHLCGRDICEKCGIYDPNDMGDYPTRYCKECWEIGEYYREKISILQIEFDEKVEILNIGWKNEAINKARQKA